MKVYRHPFFNREKEQEEIKTLLDEKPQINVIVDPPNCGKTTLMGHIFQSLQIEKKIHYISWNLRFFLFFFSCFDKKKIYLEQEELLIWIAYMGWSLVHVWR